MGWELGALLCLIACSAAPASKISLLFPPFHVPSLEVSLLHEGTNPGWLKGPECNYLAECFNKLAARFFARQHLLFSWPVSAQPTACDGLLDLGISAGVGGAVMISPDHVLGPGCDSVEDFAQFHLRLQLQPFGFCEVKSSSSPSGLSL